MFNEISMSVSPLIRQFGFHHHLWLLCPLYSMEMGQNSQYICNNELLILLNHISFYNKVDFLTLVQFFHVSKQVVRYLFLQAGNFLNFEDLRLFKQCQVLVQNGPNRLHQHLGIFAGTIGTKISVNRSNFLKWVRSRGSPLELEGLLRLDQCSCLLVLLLSHNCLETLKYLLKSHCVSNLAEGFKLNKVCNLVLQNGIIKDWVLNNVVEEQTPDKIECKLNRLKHLSLIGINLFSLFLHYCQVRFCQVS